MKNFLATYNITEIKCIRLLKKTQWKAFQYNADKNRSIVKKLQM